MIIGGVEKLTLIDFPGHLAAIVFTQGCNFRCQFCYNPLLVMPIGDIKLRYQKDHSLVPESDLFAFLESRRGKLDGVVVTGGEPTLHQDLPEFLASIRALGYHIKLDTNGTNPEMLEKVLQQVLVDYLAMDIKAPLDKYEQVVDCAVNTDNILKSIEIIKNSGLPYEFRTTLVPGLHTLEDIEAMGKLIKGASNPTIAKSSSAAKWYLQFFKSDTPLINRSMETKERFTHQDMEAMALAGQKYVMLCEVRG
jgi:pyruvate formate lyase activating enzyme